MNISQAIHLLMLLRDKHGDVEVITDCPHCGKETKPDKIVAIPSVVRVMLKEGEVK